MSGEADAASFRCYADSLKSGMAAASRFLYAVSIVLVDYSNSVAQQSHTSSDQLPHSDDDLDVAGVGVRRGVWSVHRLNGFPTT